MAVNKKRDYLINVYQFGDEAGDEATSQRAMKAQFLRKSEQEMSNDFRLVY